ncbi:hypothetical protein N7513_003557 [Penicillium frequentans]|nr:hypothetical protein N7513_004717 [Penicillium glabrum]KAJ5555915.1 hypothetical protein N7513_003557 [Penicillium glabrum]
MFQGSHPDQSSKVMELVGLKTESLPDDSTSSTALIPDAELEPFTQDDIVRTEERKGGRKPICATSGQRKQYSKQKQASFRKHRTEHIHQLEKIIKRNGEVLQSLQQRYRSTSDDCLMLQYKNSLLERILLEKGVDVQAELRLKTEAPDTTAKTSPMPSDSAPGPAGALHT